jgi:hypothetical protein
MEINWTALHVTAWSVVIIGVAGLIVADRRQRIEPNSRKHSKIPTLTEGAAELGASIDEAVGGFDSLLANFVERLSIVAREIGRVANRLRSAIADSRRPVHLNTPDEMKAPLLRASRTALWMSLILLGIGAVVWVKVNGYDGWIQWLPLIWIAFVVLPLIILSFIHTIVVRHLPWRGPIASALAGAPLALLPYVLRGRPGRPLYYLIGGAVYGVVIGLVEHMAERRPRSEASRDDTR